MAYKIFKSLWLAIVTPVTAIITDENHTCRWHGNCYIYSMRLKDKILTDITINNDRVVIAKNKSNYIIKFAPASKPNFDKKATRVKLGSLSSAIDWLCNCYGDDIRGSLNNLQKAPNLSIKDSLFPTYPRIKNKNKNRCKSGGISQNRQLSLLDDI